MSTPKTLNVTNPGALQKKISDVEVFGNPDAWVLLCKASSKSQGWMKSTKLLEIKGTAFGVLVQVTTQQGDHVAEALTFVEYATLQSFGLPQ